MTQASFRLRVLGVLNESQVRTMMRLAESSYRPPEVVELKREIAAAVEAEALQLKISGEVDEGRIRYIAGLRQELIELYCKWIINENRLSLS